ncbi:MAG: c-type cytochrome domain-containing protein [Verrucomicrobiota bacterium]
MPTRSVFASITGFCLASSASLFAQDAEKITYEDHIKPLLENKCFSCHNPDKKKGDLDLTSFGGLMTGGGGGAIVDAGNPDGSRLWTTCAKKEEPFMPPEGAPLNAKELEILAKWVTGGVLETKSSVAKKSSKPKVDMAVAVTSGRPEGPIAKPEHVLLEPVVVTPRTTAITAMAASPWTSLVAVAAPKQILLYDTDTRQLAGIFPYTEGYARTLQFSRNGSLLVMGGGRGGKFGHAVVWDVKSGKRMIEVGKEFDQAMSADISPDHKMVVVGCTSKKVKCYDSATGEELYTIAKHTEWILGTKFSPDGVLLATSDRNGNVMVWEAANGGEFYILGQHKGPCTDLAWRADSNLLASCSKDGTISVWEMNEGKQVKNWAAHGGGVQSVSFTPDGNIVSSGDDGLVRVWDVNGTKKAEAVSQGDIVAKVVALADSKTCVTSNWRGEVKVLTLQDKMPEIGQLSSNPPLIAQRIVEAEKRATELVAKLPSLQEAVKKAEADAKNRQDNLPKVQAEVTENDRKSKAYPAEIAAAEKALGEANAAVTKAQADHKARGEAIKAHADKAAKVAQLEKDLAAANAEAPQVAAADKAVADANAALEGAKKELAAKAGDAALTAKVKDLEGKIGSAKAEQQKLAASKTKIDQATAAVTKAKAELGAAPAPVAELDKVIADTNAKIKELTDTIAAKKAELPKLPALVKAGPDRIKGAESDVATGNANLALAQMNAKLAADEINVLQKLPTVLKAAQFNVGVLAEKEMLAKLEGSFNDYTAAKKENEEAKVSNAAKIESSKKAVAEAVNLLPQNEATLAKLKAELGGIEEAIKPTKTTDSAAAAKLEEAKKALATREAELAALVKARDEGTAAAKKSAEDIAKAIEGLKKKLGEVATKLKNPNEQVKSKLADVTQREGKLAEAKKTVADVTAALPGQEKAVKDAEAALAKAAADLQATEKALNEAQRLNGEGERGVKPVRQAVTSAERAVNDAKAKNAVTPELEKALTDAQGRLAAAEKAGADAAAKVTAAKTNSEKARETRNAADKAQAAARQVAGKSKNDLNNASNNAKQLETALAKSKAELDAANKVAAPLSGQHDSISKEIAAQDKARADKLAVPAALEADFAAKSKPVNEQIAAMKATLPDVEKAFAEARAKLEGEIKIVDAKKAEVAKATEELEATKAKKAGAEAAIAAAEKDAPVRDKNLAEINAELTKLQPQLDPARAKVKDLETKYLTMLPK